MSPEPVPAFLSPGLEGPAIAAPPGDDESAQRVRRLRERFLYAYHHPLWVTYRREATEDLAFVSGTGQWDSRTKAALDAESRATLTLNQIRPVVQVLVGYQRSSRIQWKPAAVGEEDVASVELLGKLMQKEAQDHEVDFELSDGFAEGVAAGLAIYFVGVDYDRDVVHGEPYLEKVRHGEVVYDPDAVRYDLSDAREVFRLKMVAVDVLLAHYPDHADTIRAALNALRTGEAPPGGATLPLPAADPRDAYRGASTADPVLYDAAREQVLVVEGWYRVWDPAYLLVDQRTNTVSEIPDDPAARTAARQVAAVDPMVTVVRRMRRSVEMSVFLPATGQELEHGSPFDNDREDYPFAQFVAYREGDQVFGIVRNLKDPQREYNKRRSAMIDAVSRWGTVMWLAEHGSVENPQWFESGGRAGGQVGWVKSIDRLPKEIPPPPLPAWVAQQDQVAKQEIKEISGINADLLGVRDADASGIAIARRQASGQIITTALYDNFKRTTLRIGKLWAKRIQQTYTAERTVRLAGPTGAAEFVTVNQRQVAAADGRVTVTGALPDLKYDVAIVDAPATPTARAAALNTLMDLAQRVPQVLPALVDVIVGLTDIPERERVLVRIRQLLAAQGLLDPETAAQLGTPQAPPVGGPAAGAAPGAMATLAARAAPAPAIMPGL